MPPELVIVPIVFLIPGVVLTVRMWFKHTEKMAALNAGQAPSRDADARMMRVESAVESMAVELERIGEGQRFLTKLLSERSQQPDAAPRIGAGK